MSGHIDLTITDLQEKLREQEASANETRKLINLLCKSANRDPIYPDTEAGTETGGGFRSDQFYGRPLATVIREILQSRKATKGAQTTAEIYDALVRGGYKFEAKNADNAKRGLLISLNKNPIFHRVPTGAWGLRDWYPSVRDRVAASTEITGETDQQDGPEVSNEATENAASKKRQRGGDDADAT